MAKVADFCLTLEGFEALLRALCAGEPLRLAGPDRLPDDFRVVGAHWDWHRQAVLVRVESDGLPWKVGQGEPVPWLQMHIEAGRSDPLVQELENLRRRWVRGFGPEVDGALQAIDHMTEIVRARSKP